MGMLLAKVRSTSDARKSHKIKLGADGRIYCSCPHWKFRCAANGCTCKHIDEYVASRLANKAVKLGGPKILKLKIA